MNQSVMFEWDPEEFSYLLASCQQDDAIQLSLKYMPDKSIKILEAGCGSGRAVKYFSDLGYQHVYGVELNEEIVRIQNERFPELSISQGDILNLPFDDNFFDVVVSYGVIEHFPEGLEAPLHALFQCLKPGGLAVVTVPSFNKLRQFKHILDRHFHFLKFKENNFIRKLFKRAPLPTTRNEDGYDYYVRPQFGAFYEYRLKPLELEEACVKAGFEMIESVPISHLDGLYHDSGFLFRRFFLKFHHWSFQVSKPAKYLNDLLKKFDFFHNHMHACVLRKPER